jgi:CHAT domain-containing protein
MTETTARLSPLSPLDLLALVEQADGEEAWRRLLREHRAVSGSEDFLRLMRDEAERFINDDPIIAHRMAEALLDAAALAGRPAHLALGLLVAGDALRFQGRFREAVQVFERARRIFRDLHDEVGWARSHTGWAWSMHHLGKGKEALEAIGRPHEILVAHGEWYRAATMDMSAGYVCRELGQYEQALEHFKRAETEFARAGSGFARAGSGSEYGLAAAKEHRARVLSRRGDFRAAMAVHAEVREAYIRLGQAMVALEQDQYIANGYAGQGYYGRALRIYGDVLVAQERAGLNAQAAWIELDMAECYLSLNRYEDALDLAEDAVARFERCGSPVEAARARLVCALARTGLGELGPALDLLGEAAKLFAAAGLSRQLGLAALVRASLLLGDGDWAAALDEAERAHDLFAERGLAVQQAQAQLLRARALVGLRRLEAAAALARSALAISEARGMLWLAHECYHVLAGVARARGDLPGALAGCAAAVDSIERVQSRLATHLRTHFLEDKLQVYDDAIALSLRLGDVPQAFGFLERGKSRALVDYLAAHPDVRARAARPVSVELSDELTRLREEHAWLYNRLYGYQLAQRPDDEQTEADTEHMRHEIESRERRIARLLERIALHDTDGDGLPLTPRPGRRPDPPGLDDRTSLVEYYFAPQGGGAFVLSDGALTFVPLAVTPEAITRLLRLWQLNLDAAEETLGMRALQAALKGNALGLLEDIYSALVAPLAEHLGGRERLIVVPYGPTHWVPFHALHDGRRYLLERFEVSVCPSSSLLRLCAGRRRGAHSALVLGCDDGGRLPHAIAEAQTVAALLPGECYLGEAATRAALIEAAPRHGVLHLAAHGEARVDNPTFAHVKLADGQLSTVDVFNLELDGAMVTLSACETGRAVVAGGDELVGLSRGFLFAGASALVQSLWRVEDDSTARLMERFYRGLRAGGTKGSALREAQLESLADDTHPYFWAPFQLVGDGGTL